LGKEHDQQQVKHMSNVRNVSRGWGITSRSINRSSRSSSRGFRSSSGWSITNMGRGLGIISRRSI